MDIRISCFIIAVIFGILGNVWSKDREELIPQKGKKTQKTICHCMNPQLCPRVLLRYTKSYMRAETELKQDREICPVFKEICCQPVHITVVKSILQER